MKQQYISIRHLSKKFNKDFVLKDINAVLNSNEILGFLGPSGAGKTTTIKILTGQLKPTSGNAEILGIECDKINERIYALLNDGVIVEYGSPQAICLKHNQIKKYRVRLTDGTTHLLLQNEKTTGQIAQWMNSGQLETIHSCEPTLETVFLDTTGRNLQ